MYKILIEKKAAKFLSKLDSKNYCLISKAIKNLSSLREQKNLDVKLRLRVGSRRILFTVDKEQKEIRIWIIENRGGVY